MNRSKSSGRLAAWVASASVGLLAGCGGGPDHGVELNPVHGYVERGGAPLANVDVRFYATPPSATLPGVPVPKALTDESGRFTLRTFDPDDGAPEGEYLVTLRLVEIRETPGGQLEEADLFDGAYASPRTPFTTITVSAGTNRLEPFVVD